MQYPNEMNSALILRADKYVRELLSKIPKKMFFHNLQHTLDVVEGVLLLGEKNELATSELEIVVLAAWFHDTGFNSKYFGHEKESQNIAFLFLTEEEYDEEKIDLVLQCIESTCVPQYPRNLMQRVLCDADLMHLSKDNYPERLCLLREEWEVVLNNSYLDQVWYTENLKFLRDHRYYTSYGKRNLSLGVMRNIERLQILALEEAQNGVLEPEY